MSKEQTLGEARVRTEFNPSADGQVDQIKQTAAKLIDLINALPVPHDQESAVWRLKSLGMTAAEEAAMWGVKAATI